IVTSIITEQRDPIYLGYNRTSNLPNNDFLYKYNPYIVDGRILSREEKGTLNLLLKREVRRSLKDKNTEYIVLYTIAGEDYKLTTNDLRLAKLFRKFTDIFPNDLLKELPPERNFVYYININTADLVNINTYPLFYKKLKELRK
ncbi:hypothetical protein N7537_007285, partial [Penicillium hordei]